MAKGLIGVQIREELTHYFKICHVVQSQFEINNTDCPYFEPHEVLLHDFKNSYYY